MMIVQAMKMALEVLYDSVSDNADWIMKRERSVAALRAAIEAAEKQEPAFYMCEGKQNFDAPCPNCVPFYAAPVCAVPDGWQPIETAPKDGKRFLCATTIPKHRQVIAMCGVAGILLDEQCQPLPWPMTHWRPLPAAPEYGK